MNLEHSNLCHYDQAKSEFAIISYHSLSIMVDWLRKGLLSSRDNFTQQQYPHLTFAFHFNVTLLTSKLCYYSTWNGPTQVKSRQNKAGNQAVIATLIFIKPTQQWQSPLPSSFWCKVYILFHVLGHLVLGGVLPKSWPINFRVSFLRV